MAASKQTSFQLVAGQGIDPDSERDASARQPTARNLVSLRSGREFGDLVRAAPELRLQAERELFHEGEVAAQIFFVTSGLIGLYLSTEQGHEVEVGECPEGGLVGVEALRTASYQASARAVQPTVLHVLDRNDVMEIVTRSPTLCLDVLRDTLLDLGQVRRRLLDLAGRCARERLALSLLQSAVMSDGRPWVAFPWGSKARLARHIGIKQETLSRVLQEFVEERLIRIVPGGAELLNRTRLKEIAG